LVNETDETVRREICTLYLHAFINSELAEVLSEKVFESSMILPLIMSLTTPEGMKKGVPWVMDKAPTIYERARRSANLWQETPSLSRTRANIARSERS
jgi:hypothetical protein